MKYTYRQRCEIIQRARSALARAAVDEAIRGLAAERELFREDEADQLAFERRQRERRHLIRMMLNARR
jgi:hypothetical protein